MVGQKRQLLPPLLRDRQRRWSPLVGYIAVEIAIKWRFYQRARSATADQGEPFSFNFPGCWGQIPDKLLIPQPTEAVKTQINWNRMKLM